MIARAVWARDLPEVNDGYRFESRDLNRHGNVKETLKAQFFSRRFIAGKHFRLLQRIISIDEYPI